MFWRAWISALIAASLTAVSWGAPNGPFRVGLLAAGLLTTLLGAIWVKRYHEAALAESGGGQGSQVAAKTPTVPAAHIAASVLAAPSASTPLVAQPAPAIRAAHPISTAPVTQPTTSAPVHHPAEANVTHLLTGAQEAHSAVQEVWRLTGRVNELLSQLHQATAQQLGDLDRTRDLARQVVAVFSEMTEAARQARDEAAKHRADAESVQRALGLIGEGMAAIRTATDTSAETISDLGRQTSQIGEIVKLIQNLADQTNLLSLNAAIEAARAGEAGRGFAVVAQEVRVLADRSRAATRQIQELVSAIQTGSQAAISVMAQSRTEVNRGAATVESTRGAIEQVLQSFEGLSGTVEGFGEQAESTTGEMVELVRSVEEATRLAHQNNGTVKELVDATWFSQAIKAAERCSAALVQRLKSA